jgi:hypothetical protein
MSTEFENWLKSKGINQECSTADNQWQNGIAERAHRTITEMAQAMRVHANMARRWWAEAAHTAVFIQNRLLNSADDEITPQERMTGRRPTLSNMRVFGCVCYNMIKAPEKRNKLASKASKCVLLGYSEQKKAYKLYDIEEQKVITSVQVTFSEKEFLEPANYHETRILVDDDDDENESSRPAKRTAWSNANFDDKDTHSTLEIKRTANAIKSSSLSSQEKIRMWTIMC